MSFFLIDRRVFEEVVFESWMKVEREGPVIRMCDGTGTMF